jgi:hydroxymethylpyrimidine/phosphomethylpyrimidine kinase
VLTPNLPEAAALLELSPAESEAEMEQQAQQLLALGPDTIVLMGGHGKGASSVDLVVDRNGTVSLSFDRIATKNNHGTGCTFSAALAAGLAKGISAREAARDAKRYVHQALANADRLIVGSGHGPLHHFHDWW